ncbi:hypothetical protein COLO4_35829 [Corchorus olitorius]|uniref:Uncharacterized protein n=1 Tax=Corchorus olitorius TaxID=93759 RepID=A0A1R3GD00_9ROSI|nr:hypothetical protein COLO4_35829 [Corchorus olitorius]
MVAILAKIQHTLQYLPILFHIGAYIDQIFYDGLEAKDRKIIDGASQGTLTNKNPIEARELVNQLADNIHQYGGLNEELPIKEPHREQLVEEMKEDEELFPQITHTDVSNNDRISKTIEIQAEDKLIKAEEMVAKLESCKQELLNFNLDEPDEPLISVYTEVSKEENEIEESKEEEILSKSERSLEIVTLAPFPSQLLKKKKGMIEDEQL